MGSISKQMANVQIHCMEKSKHIHLRKSVQMGEKYEKMAKLQHFKQVVDSFQGKRAVWN